MKFISILTPDPNCKIAKRAPSPEGNSLCMPFAKAVRNSSYSSCGTLKSKNSINFFIVFKITLFKIYCVFFKIKLTLDEESIIRSISMESNSTQLSTPTTNWGQSFEGLNEGVLLGESKGEEVGRLTLGPQKTITKFDADKL